ncbi:hypothetical protein R5R35_010257 [Gryllus longicercus]|uniref:RING-type domain-containing protein n=1 Tax=Gryllus longicercus TaxID=2509291 RepID=A0AAN9VMW4_9ORTH
MARSDDGRRNRVFDTAMAAPVVSPRSHFSPSTSGSLNLKSKEDRLTTFSGWPVSFMSENSLATAGFYYLHKGDVVRCAFCGVEVAHWEEGDNPMEEHRRWSPSCPILRKSTSNAGSSTSSSTNANSNPVYDECGLYGIEIRPNSGPENGKPLLEQLGVNKSRGPVHRAFTSYNARMQSFETWPLSLKPRPEELVEAGFFYTGKSDQTLCFNCGCGLRNWEPTDDPWIEHAKWSSQCSFVVLNKGKDFIQKAMSKEQPLLQPEDIEKLGIKEEKQTLKSANSCSTELQQTAKKSPELSSDRLCKICLQEELGVVFLPCGHLVACVKCAPKIENCPICRKPLTATVRAFLS